MLGELHELFKQQTYQPLIAGQARARISCLQAARVLCGLALGLRGGGELTRRLAVIAVVFLAVIGVMDIPVVKSCRCVTGRRDNRE